MIEAYPLTWPETFPRSKGRVDGAFKTSLAGALKNVNDSLRRFAADSGKKIEQLVISSNVSLGQERPPDPGVAVWFAWDGLQVCIPVDRYAKVEANLQAIHHIIEARRTELRHGGLAIVRATFTGFKSLPAPGQTSARNWRNVLGVGEKTTLEEVGRLYKSLRSFHHPEAWDQAQGALS
ncbi:MAG: J domain-containing protein [Betaproteobacteria bacterium]|nr:J domain-containing protein [Betaproteobacteria bacterium]